MTYPPGSSPGRVRAQLAAPSALGPQTLLSCHCWGSQAPNATGPQAPQASHVGGVGAGLGDGIQGRWCSQKVAEAGRGSLPPQGLGAASRGRSEGSGGQQDTDPHISPGSPDHHWSEAGWTGAPWRGGQDWLLPHCPCDKPCSADLAWLSPLMVTHWQLLPWGEEPIENGWTGLAAW